MYEEIISFERVVYVRRRCPLNLEHLRDVALANVSHDPLPLLYSSLRKYDRKTLGT